MNVSLNSQGTSKKVRAFDALTPDEIQKGVALLKPHIADDATFISVCLEEPKKQAVQFPSKDEQFPSCLLYTSPSPRDS